MKPDTTKRAALLATVVGLAFLLVACGRATESDILSAVGITPTATRSPEELATATAAAVAAQETAAAVAASSPAAGSSPAVAVVGDVNRGRGVFGTWCQNCHQPGGNGPASDILAAGSAGASLNPAEFTTFIREGTNHQPGPYRTSDFSDRQLNDLLAYIVAEASS